MTDFPNNFDYVIYGTGVTESILSSALSITGKSVLHIDKNTYYGGYNACLRLSELEELLNKWIEYQENLTENESDIFNYRDSQVSHVDLSWHVKEDNIEEINGNDSNNCTNCIITKKSLKSRLRGFEFELIPKLVYCESQTVDALIQSDVTRYLEFKFISKFASIVDDNIISIPINRSDIVKTRVFSLRQKRQLTSFLEWCFSISSEDDVVKKYSNQPLYQLMRTEKNIDPFTENIIIQCLALSSPDVETVKGLEQIQRLLKSFNKFGPYPIMWPNYGSGEIPQAFCRMSAVFGGTYSLSTSILSCTHQDSANGDNQPDGEVPPPSHRKLRLHLSNGTDAFADKLICAKGYLGANVLAGHEARSQVCRAILVTDRSLLSAEREPNDILLLPLAIENLDRPAMLLELPTERRTSDSEIDLFVTHLVAHTRSQCSAKELFSGLIGKLFQINKDGSVIDDGLKPRVLLECYFGVDSLRGVDVVQGFLGDCIVFTDGAIDNLEFDENVIEAREIFARLCPGEAFLPRPPNPEDIIALGDEAVPAAGAPRTAGDFPFSSEAVAMETEAATDDGPTAPGDEQ